MTAECLWSVNILLCRWLSENLYYSFCLHRALAETGKAKMKSGTSHIKGSTSCHIYPLEDTWTTGITALD